MQLRRSVVPPGLVRFVHPIPGAEAPGYFQSPLRGAFKLKQRSLSLTLSSLAFNSLRLLHREYAIHFRIFQNLLLAAGPVDRKFVNLRRASQTEVNAAVVL